jgi:hypothetical protein
MDRLEYTAECLCGGKFLCLFKKPTRMQHTLSKAKCSNCKSEAQFYCFKGQNEKGQTHYYCDHDVIEMTDILKNKMKESAA